MGGELALVGVRRVPYAVPVPDGMGVVGPAPSVPPREPVPIV